jgi:hypothetical protein
MYRGLGLDLCWTPNPLETGVLKVCQRMGSGRLKVFASLAKYLDERRLYRCDGSNQIVRQHDNLQDAVRCLVNGIVRFRRKPVKQPALPSPRYTERSWMGWEVELELAECLSLCVSRGSHERRTNASDSTCSQRCYVRPGKCARICFLVLSCSAS